MDGLSKGFHKDLGCEVRAIEEILKPIDGCPSSMESIEFGYANPIKQKSYVLGEACYSIEKGQTIFLHTRLSAIDNFINEPLSTKNVDYFNQRHPESKYKLDLLVASRLDTLNERLTEALGKNIPFLEPRHFLGINILPNKQYLSILKLGWNYVVTNGYDHVPNMNLLQNDIQNLKVNGFDVYMGSSGVLQLPNDKGTLVDIYLNDEEKRFPVPKYLWTVVKTENKAAAFAILNNPEANENDVESLCPSKCTQISWIKNLLLNDAYKNSAYGYVVCCNLDDFAKAVDEMPPLKGKYDLLV